MKQMNRNKTLVVPMLIMVGMFSALGFAVGIDAFFIPFVEEAFDISTTMSYLVMTATFASFVFFSVPSGILIKKTGYKGGMVVAFVLLALSFLLISVSAMIESFPMFLGALFVNGMGRVVLNAAVNPYITVIGPQESAARRISVMGISNKVSYAAASLILAIFMDLSDVDIKDVIVPFFAIAGIMLVVGLLSYFAPLPEVEAQGESDVSHERLPEDLRTANSKDGILQFPHLVLGVIAYFFYTGAEVTALGSINHYAVVLGMPSPENYVWLTSLAMVIGYVFGIVLIPGKLSQVNALRLSAVLGAVLSIFIAILPDCISIYMLAAMGLANALILPAIWPLSLAGLGKFTKIGSGFLVMGGIGGAVIPLLYGGLVDASIPSPWAYCIIFLPSYLYILYFGTKGYLIRTK